MRKHLVSAVCAGLTLCAASVSSADSVADFYKDKTVSVVSPSGTGGSIYEYALLVSNHIGRHIPGNPTVIVEDRGGGGGIKAANYVENAVPDTGLVIAELHPSSLVVPITTDNAKFDFTKVNWPGSVAVRPYVGVVWNTTEADTLEKMRDTEVIFGSSGAGGSSYQYPFFLAKISGAKIKMIPGYKSGGAMNLAMESGEINGRGNYYEGFLATNPDWVRDNKIKYVFRMGDDHPDLMNVPQASDYATNEADQKMLAFLEAPLKVGQAFYVHGNVPADRLVALRKAFTDMVNDPVFLADADKMGLVIRTRTAEQVGKVVSDLYATPRNLISDLDSIFKQ